jgi:hypothetical protein
MRLSIAGIALAGIALTAAVPFTSRELAVPVSAPENNEKSGVPYDPNPAHIWNRLHDALLIREGPTGAKYGEDSLDPLLWGNTKHLLAQPSHDRALRVLDQFLETHAENLIHDPVKRAIMQRDLWAVFDWSVERQPGDEDESAFQKERHELQIRLAEVLRRLALTSKEVESLPDNYAEAVASKTFAQEYDPDHRDRAFLPPDLFEPRGPWVLISGNGSEPVARQHVSEFSGRSRFLVFVRLPGGRKSTLDYFQTLWNLPQPSIPPSGTNARVQVQDLQIQALQIQALQIQALPQFPAGTEVALVRQMTLFDERGNLVPAPITESVQIRVYQTITASKENRYESQDFEELSRRSGQAFYEFTLSRPQLFAGKAGGLRATERDEREFFVRADDPFEPLVKNLIPLQLRTGPIFLQCAICHSAGGINSLESRGRLLKPNPLQQDVPGKTYGPRWWASDQTINWKRDRNDWRLLNEYWRTGNVSH